MRISLAYLLRAGLSLGLFGFILTIIGLGVRAWLKAYRPDSESRWFGIPVIFAAPGEFLEFVGLFLVLMPLANTITLRSRFIIESQFLLTLWLAILPILLSAVFVRGFNHLMHKYLIPKRPVKKEEDRKEVVEKLIDRI